MQKRLLNVSAALQGPALIAAAALLFVLAGAGCDEGPTLGRARDARTMEAYEDYLATNPPEPQRSEAFEELAELTLEALGPQPPAEDAARVLKRFRRTAAGPRIERVLAEAEYRDILLNTRDDPEAMFEAFRQWRQHREAAAPELARSASREINEAVLERLNAPGISSETAVRMLRLVQQPADEVDYLNRLLEALERIPADSLLLRSTIGFSPRWMSPAGNELWRRSARKLLGRGLTPNSPAPLLLAYLRAFQTDPPSREWRQVRSIYDESRVQNVLASPSRGAVEGYLADSYAERMKEEWAQSLEELDRALQANNSTILQQFIALKPNHLLIEDAKRQLELLREYERLQLEKQRIVSQLGRVDRTAPVAYSPPPTPLPASITERALVVVETDGRALATIALDQTGLLLGQDRDLAQTGRANSTALMPDLTKVPAQMVASDKETGLVLFKLREDADTLRDKLPAVKFMDSRLARRGAEVSLAGIFQAGRNIARGGGRISATGDELPGSIKKQTFHIWLDKPLSFDSGFLFNDRGEALGVLVEQKNAREFLALGLASAAPLVERHYESLLRGLKGDGPDGPSLISGGDQ